MRIKSVKERPRGHRVLGKEIKRSELAVQVDFYGKPIWIPKRALRSVPGLGLTAPTWAVQSGLDFYRSFSPKDPTP